MKRFWGLLAALLWAGVAAMAQTAPTTRPAKAPAATGPVARAVLIAGLGGSKAYSRNLLDWTNRFHKVLTTRCGVKAENIVVLTETAGAKATPPRLKSTLVNVTKVLEQVRKQTGPKDQFILFMAGHGQINEPVGKLCLPGPDLRADKLADILDRLPTGRIVIINAASGAAEFIKTCTGTGRVIISGGGAEDDGTQTYFAEFFLRGYETGQADANKDKTIDLMEAYTYAARWTANFYHRQHLIPNRGRDAANQSLTWYVRGKETRVIWKRLYAGTTDRLGVPRRRADEPAPPDPDTEPDPKPKFGRFDVHWHNRRILTEHARIDDGDTKRGFYLWQPYKFQKLPPNEPGATGYLARRVVLGRPQLLKTARPK